jgi:soluble lytic murein transglycosylase
VVSRRFQALFLVVVCLPALCFPQTHKKKKSAVSTHATRLQHINRAFVASADLKPMAQQLLENRTPQAYAAVEAYARKQSSPDAGALAWLVLGYAHYLDKDYAGAGAAWQQTSALEPVLGDYLAWLRASAYQGDNKPQAVMATLEGFDQKYPDSPNLHDVQLLYAGALTSRGQSQQAAVYLEKRRQPYHPDLELALARAYLASEQKAKAIDVFEHIYFDAPLSPEAEIAAQELRGLGQPKPVGSFEQHHARGQILLKGHRYQDAVNEFSPLTERAPSGELTSLQLEFATALYKSRKHDEAAGLFENVAAQAKSASAEQRAQAVYYLAEIARDKNDDKRHDALLSQLRTEAPNSPWFEDALLSTANMYMLRNDFGTSASFFTELYQHQPSGRFAANAHWKAAWLNYRLNKRDEAARLFDEHLALYPTSSQAPAALYWRARLAEDRGDRGLARAYYQKLSENYLHFYYANLARDRLARMSGNELMDPPLLGKLPGPPSAPKNWDAPADNLRAQKAQLLANAALYDFAIKELQLATTGLPPWLAKSEAAVYGDQGSYIHAIQTMKRVFPGYSAVQIDQLPRPVWDALFPRPFWDDLRRNSLQHQLDPYLVASLIRQESEFDPAAVSPANAMGLMQLLPHVGRNLAKEMKIGRFSSDQLLQPGINLQLGTRYFKQIVDHYDGQVAYALAAYNAGENRVAEWRASGTYRDTEEFVESIPFTETREYVQAILRNVALYRLLYPEK